MNKALRKEVLHYITSGVRQAAKMERDRQNAADARRSSMNMDGFDPGQVHTRARTRTLARTRAHTHTRAHAYALWRSTITSSIA